ncbi:MAG: transposase [Geminicoccaceae bacterium]
MALEDPGLSNHDVLHYCVSADRWDGTTLEAKLPGQAERLVGGPSAYFVIGGTALRKKGTSSIGVAPQYASALN